MAYIIKSLRKFNVKEPKIKNKNLNGNGVFIFIIILCTIVIGVDYALVMSFINILKNI